MRQRGPQRLGHERHDRVEQPQVRVEHLDERPPRRLTHLGRRAVVGQADLGQLQAPVAELVPDGVVERGGSPRRTRSRPSPRRPSAVVAAARDRIQRSAGPRWRGIGQRAARRPRRWTRAGPRARTGSRSRACWRSCGRSRAWPWPKRWSLPGVAPWMRAKRSASAPTSSIIAERVDDVALRLRHLRPYGSRMSPDR